MDQDPIEFMSNYPVPMTFHKRHVIYRSDAQDGYNRRSFCKEYTLPMYFDEMLESLRLASIFRLTILHIDPRLYKVTHSLPRYGKSLWDIVKPVCPRASRDQDSRQIIGINPELLTPYLSRIRGIIRRLNKLGLIHNDFALRNICVDRYGNCHLIDFYVH